MKLLDLEVENFLGLPDGRYAFTHPTTGAPLPLVLVGGGPSSGKTSLLEAIIALKESVGSYHVLPEPSRLLRSGKRSGQVRGRWLLSPEEMAKAGLSEPTFTAALELGGGEVRAPEPALEALFSAYTRDPAAWKAEYFPCDRRLVPRVGLAPPGEADGGRLRLTRRPDKYAGLEQVLMQLAVEDGLQAMAHVKESGILLRGDQRDSLAPYKAAVAALCPWLRLSGVEPRGGAAALWFERDNGARVELYSLSHGEQQAVLFALVHVFLGLRRALVLIDAPEAHIHPSEQSRLLHALAGLGEDHQIIAATGSSELLGSVPRHQTLLCRSKHG
ncbi:AAA family ATPase [Sorangium sp. So ce834]|uniref:ATP-dependent nuclease n=1 Tax=Sorangium sp. So ce834 TaxID=3133321 RepID=UPI003F635EFB